MKKYIIGVVVDLMLCLISLIMIIVAICFIVSMARVYPRPLDSFWSLELSITLIIVFSILLIVSVVGIIFFCKKLKKCSMES